MKVKNDLLLDHHWQLIVAILLVANDYPVVHFQHFHEQDPDEV